MNDCTYRHGDILLRTGLDLPHLGVFNGQAYEVQDFHRDEGLFVKGVPAGLDPAGFTPVEGA